MTKQVSPHLACGQLVALAKLDSNIEKHSSAKQHFQECKSCTDDFEKVKNLLQISTNKLYQQLEELTNSLVCDEYESNLEKHAVVFIALLSEPNTEESSLKLFSHLNSCYPCFESLTINWNAYLTFQRELTSIGRNQ